MTRIRSLSSISSLLITHAGGLFSCCQLYHHTRKKCLRQYSLMLLHNVKCPCSIFFILASEGVYASAECREKHTKLHRKSGLQSSEQVTGTASHLLILQEKSFPPRAWQECQSQVQVHGHLNSNSILSQVWKEARLRHYPKLNAWILKRMEHSNSGGKVYINSRPTDYKSLISFPV